MTITAKIIYSDEKLQVVGFDSTEQSYGTEAIEEAISAATSLPIDYRKGVVISHRGAIWLHSALAHHFHVAAWVAHLDLRLGGGVVVQSHAPGINVAQVVEIPKLAA